MRPAALIPGIRPLLSTPPTPPAAALAAALVGTLALAGCGPELAAAALSTTVLVTTDKTITDHVVSVVRGEDCSTVAYQRDGTYCTLYPPEMRVVREEIYCYRTLADVDCYPTPAPFGGNPQPVSRQFTREVVRPVETAP